MTGPLVDRDEIASAIWESPVGRPDNHAAAADRVMQYLREVLTPEALWPQPEPDDDPDEGVPRSTVRLVNSLLIPETIHRRIFGAECPCGLTTCPNFAHHLALSRSDAPEWTL